MTLAELRARGLLELLDLELARALCRIANTDDEDTALAIALTSRSVRQGHSCFPMRLSDDQVWPTERLLSGALPERTSWIRRLAASPLCERGPLVLDSDGRLYLRRYWELEQKIASTLAARSEGLSLDHSPEDVRDERLGRLFPDGPTSPGAHAARTALAHRISLLCGGPGTGKTTTVSAILAGLIEEAGARGEPAPSILLLAPTGKAAARLGDAVRRAKSRIDVPMTVLDAIPTEASTVQRALGMRSSGMRFSRNAERPLEADVIVVDEASMIDLALMHQLLQATRPDARLIVVGDPNQLTSVEAGSVLQDLVTAGSETWWKNRMTTLTKTYRYDATRPLGKMIEAVRAGDRERVEGLVEGSGQEDIVWSPGENLSEELDRSAKRWTSIVETTDVEEHFKKREEYVVLTPFRKGPRGTRRLSAAIQERLTVRGSSFAPAHPILIEENSNELRVYNGDFAMIREGELRIGYIQGEEGKARAIAEARLPRYSDAYALSVHKAQGSEFDEVLLILPEEDAPLLTRELLYTALSRARQRVRIVGPKEVLLSALARRARRHSGLIPALGHAAPPKQT